jgi:hypothetical protein
LNELLTVTSAQDRTISHALTTSHVVLTALVQIVHQDCLELNNKSDYLPSNETKNDKPVFPPSSKAWTQAPSRRSQAWARLFQTKLSSSSLHRERLQTLQVILVILRNFSYVGANSRLLAYSPDVLDIFMGCLYESTTISTSTDTTTSTTTSTADDSACSLAQSALQALLNLAPYLDWSGQRLVTDRLLYVVTPESYKVPEVNNDDCDAPDDDSTPEDENRMLSDSSFGMLAAPGWGWMGLHLAKRFENKEDGILSKDWMLALAGSYLTSVWSLWAGLCHVLTTTPSIARPTLLLALDLLQELVSQARVGVVGDVDDEVSEIPSLRAVLVHMPDCMLDKLVDCLYIPKQGPDALDYNTAAAALWSDSSQRKAAATTTASYNKLAAQSYDATVDADVRDRALDILVPLLELDTPRMAARLGRDVNRSNQIQRRLFDMILPILTTTVGKTNEASLLASQVLRELSRAPENRLGLEYVQARLVELASRDARVAHLVWNHLYHGKGSSKESGELMAEQLAM